MARPASLASAGLITLALLAAVTQMAGCRPVVPAHSNVVLISLDTLRRDRVCGFAPGACAITPELGKFGEDAIRYTSAHSPISFTLPAHMTLITGTEPDVHRVLWKEDQLSTELSTLAELLQRAGYRTAGVYSNTWLSPTFGFGRGFDSYDEVPFDLEFAKNVVGAGEKLLDRFGEQPGKPFFLFLHFMDAHSDFHDQTRSTLPYYSPGEFRQDLPYAEDSKLFCSSPSSCATGLLLDLNAGSAQASPEVLRALPLLYDAGIRFLDQRLGELFADLRARKLLDDTLIVILADHGEEFGEHGRFLHDQAFEEELRIPLLIRLPGGERGGITVDAPVDLADVAATILTRVGLAVPDSSSGRDLLAVRELAADHPTYFVDRFRRSKVGLIRSNWKYTEDFLSGQRSLFDLRVDPGESTDLSSAHPGLVDELSKLLRSEVRAHTAASRHLGATTHLPGLTKEQEARLKSLGYL